MKWLRKIVFLWFIILVTFGCAKQNEMTASQAMVKVLSQSLFAAGESVPDTEAVSTAVTQNSAVLDSGFIAPPSGQTPSGGGNDGGTIAPPSSGEQAGGADSGAIGVVPGTVVINEQGTPVTPVISPTTPVAQIPDPGTPSPSTQDGGQIPNSGTQTPSAQDGGQIVVVQPATPSTQDGGTLPTSGSSTPSSQDGGQVAVVPTTPPSTQDGGQTTPVSPKPPTTGGTCPTPNKDPFRFQLRRVCSVNRSKNGGLFFEDAKNPIITVEAVSNSSGGMSSFLASPGFARLPKNSVYVKSSNGVTAFSVASMSLKGVDLLQKPYASPLALALDQFKNKMGMTWAFAYLNIRVCEDTNQDGFCFDELGKNQLAFDVPDFKANSLPRSIQLNVWSGRFLTLKGSPDKCEMQYSPLVLDLKGNGLALVGPDKGVSFDINDTGESIPTGWIGSPDDALLVRDLNENGRIDSGAELFGNATSLTGGGKAANGFEALKALDSNADGFITPTDTEWTDLKLWVDRNQDGFSQRSELMTLDRANIESINLGYIKVLEVDPHGNQTRERSTFVRRVLGKRYVLVVSDVWFNSFVAE